MAAPLGFVDQATKPVDCVANRLDRGRQLRFDGDEASMAVALQRFDLGLDQALIGPFSPTDPR
jgi:hypothetical protein